VKRKKHGRKLKEKTKKKAWYSPYWYDGKETNYSEKNNSST